MITKDMNFINREQKNFSHYEINASILAQNICKTSRVVVIKSELVLLGLNKKTQNIRIVHLFSEKPHILI
jgi:hypothetical protein